MASAIQFKLSKQDGLTRRLAFPDRPSWALLSSKIGAMYGIATYNVGVSYIDQDGDEVTLSSEEELQDHYSTLGTANDTIKLAVQDLSSLRSTYFTPSRPNTTTTPQQSHFRNTFGEADLLPFVFEVDDDWERLPRSMGDLFTPESPHAFVEVLDSDVSFSNKTDNAGDESSAGDTTRSDATFTLHTGRADKGKARNEIRPTVEDDVSSTDSVYGDDAPIKPQVHVYDLSHSEFQASIFGDKAKSAVSASGTATPAQAQSTPVISGQALPEAVPHSTEDSNASIDDPALPTLDNSTTNNANASSLTHDIAEFLTTFSGIISSHPELSEGVRNIVNNTANGTYWASHREALARAADGIQQETGRTVEEIRRMEEEAGVRVADALGGVFRVFGDAVQTARNTAESFQPPQPPAAHGRPRAPEPAPQSAHPFYPCNFPLFPRPPPPPPPGHFPHHPVHHWGPPGPPHGRRHGWPRPPPPFWGVPPPPDRREEVPTQMDRHADATRTRMSDIRTTLAEARNRRLGQANPANVLPETPIPPPVPSTPVIPSPPILQSESSPFGTAPPTQEELRADVERAKADYKMRKERYRQAKAIKKMAEQREQARQDSSGSINISGQPTVLDITDPNLSGTSQASHVDPVPEPLPSSSTPAAAPPNPQPEPQIQIVSNARGPYPQLEMFSVPRRSHTIGHTQRRGGFGLHDERETRSMQRIMRKLSEMGFTEGTCPKLNVKVTEQILANPPATKDAEDDIVTNLIEELIPSRSTHPRASTSRDPIPGAWA